MACRALVARSALAGRSSPQRCQTGVCRARGCRERVAPMCCALGRRALSNESRRSAGASAMVDPDLLARHLDRVLSDATIPELPNHYRGKVRDNYDLPDGRRIIIATDRLSAFDRIITAIPFKGQVLTQIARFWFDATHDICPNHVIGYPDPNVLVGRRLAIMPVEIVVRDYLTGTTGTAICPMYRAGRR